MTSNLTSDQKLEILKQWNKIAPEPLLPPDCTRPKDGATAWDLVVLEPYGRCMVANRDIEEGEFLYCDHPIITGPKTDCGFMCLGCYKQLDDEWEDIICSKCGWTVCSEECESAGFHPIECPVLSKNGYKPHPDDFCETNPMYEAILPLRCLLLKEHSPSKWETLVSMEAHSELRKGTELWMVEQRNVCDFLHEKIGVEESDEEIHVVTGILDVNCHEVRSNIPGTQDEYRVRGIYPISAMMSHDCKANTHHTLSKNLTMVMVASRKITKGEQVTSSYTHLLSGTIERRRHLRYGKLFDCQCERCKDATELGTFFSGIRCYKAECKGFALPILQNDSNNISDFQCNQCQHLMKGGVVNRLTNQIYLDLNTIDDTNPEQLEAVFKKYQGALHPNHFHLIGIKHSLSQVYGRVSGFMLSELTTSQMQRKVECCKDLLKILDVLDPGLSRLRGLTLYELHAPLLLRANKAFQSKCIMREDFLEGLSEALELLQKAIYCLQYEPISSFEGQICKIARGSSEELQKWIDTVKKLPDSAFVVSEENNLDKELGLASMLRRIEDY